MPNKAPTTYPGSMNDYAEAAKKAGLIKLAEKLFEDQSIKLAGQQTLDQLGLPTLKYLSLPLHQFVANSSSYFRQLNSALFHITLLSDLDGQRRLRAFPFKRHQVLTYIREKVTAKDLSKYNLIIKEFYPNIYGGNLLISKNTSVTLEAVKGDHIHIVLGSKNCVAFGHRAPYQKKFDLFTDHSCSSKLRNPYLDQALRNVLNCIPNSYPGYYEYILIRNGKKTLRPVFIDYRDRDIYQINDKVNS